MDSSGLRLNVCLLQQEYSVILKKLILISINMLETMLKKLLQLNTRLLKIYKECVKKLDYNQLKFYLRNKL